MPEREPPCQRLACAIQTCIQRNQFQQERCNHIVRDLHRCCKQFYERHGNDARTPNCPVPDVVEAKLRALEP